jgi:hypothetical protein
MYPNVVDNHQEASSSLVDAFFAYIAALIDECDFEWFALKSMTFSIY